MAGHGIPRVSGYAASAGHEQELQKIQNYRHLADTVVVKMHDRIYGNNVMNMTTRLLEMNPEYYTVWNYRRLLLRHFFNQASSPVPEENAPCDNDRSLIIQQYIVDDLTFLLPLLKKFPKCYWIWNYRTWLLDEASRLLPAAAAHQLWQKELLLVGKMLGLDSRNFHGWGYRRKVVAELEKLSANSGSAEAPTTEDEFKYTTKMIESNLSNFSAWHRRSKLIPRLLDERNASHSERQDFLAKELKLIQRALWADPDSKDQSLWFYHQYLISNFEPSTKPHTFVPDLSVDDKLDHVKSQIEDLQEMLEGAETCKWIYQRLLDLSLMGRELSGRWPVEPSFVETWIDEVAVLDPLRKGRWGDLKLRFKL